MPLVVRLMGRLWLDAGALSFQSASEAYLSL